MASRSSSIPSRLQSLDELLASLRVTGTIAESISRWTAASAALQFHHEDHSHQPQTITILGGTGTGKSTLVNRLLNQDLTAASFRRTFTAGAIALTASKSDIPPNYLNLPHEPAEELPARGQPDRLIIVEHASDLTQRATLIDTPDLDGDNPAHHAQADRAFRWAQAALFLVTPEKYQMTELLPYYRLAHRYAVPAVFVMNKVEEQEPVDDYAKQLAAQGYENAPVFAVPRDDSAFQPENTADLNALAQTLKNLPSVDTAQREAGLRNRAADLLDRLHDQILSPLTHEREESDRLIETLRAMEAPEPTVDVNPLTRQLARRLQQRSILYLMGPQRILDRVRQVPSLLVRLPRTTWDWFMTGKADLSALNNAMEADARHVPDFSAALIDQFSVLQTRIEDTLRSSPTAHRWIEGTSLPLAAPLAGRVFLDRSRAGVIADEELADLKSWLENRWNATPRDTAILMKVIRHLPGGEKLTQWSEAAPYLLAIVVATHHAFFGHIDLMILGGYSLAAWLTERLSNEVASRTRLTNKRIAMRFERLAHEQITFACDWINTQAPSQQTIDKLKSLAEELGAP
jgi:hypothetical protein